MFRWHGVDIGVDYTAVKKQKAVTTHLKSELATAFWWHKLNGSSCLLFKQPSYFLLAVLRLKGLNTTRGFGLKRGRGALVESLTASPVMQGSNHSLMGYGHTRGSR